MDTEGVILQSNSIFNEADVIHCIEGWDQHEDGSRVPFTQRRLLTDPRVRSLNVVDPTGRMTHDDRTRLTWRFRWVVEEWTLPQKGLQKRLVRYEIVTERRGRHVVYQLLAVTGEGYFLKCPTPSNLCPVSVLLSEAGQDISHGINANWRLVNACAQQVAVESLSVLHHGATYFSREGDMIAFPNVFTNRGRQLHEPFAPTPRSDCQSLIGEPKGFQYA